MHRRNAPVRRARAVLLIAVAMVAAVAVPVMAAAPWESPNHSITAVDPDGGTLMPGDTVSVNYAGFGAGETVRLAVCARLWIDALNDLAYSSSICSAVTDTVADDAGAATLDYVIPPLELTGSAFPSCVISTFGFKSGCAVVAFTGNPRTAVVAANIELSTGTSSIVGQVVDPVGVPVASASINVCQLGTYDCRTIDTVGGNFNSGLLPAGDYSVQSSSTDAAPVRSNAIAVSVADGEQVEGVELPVVPQDATSGPIGARGATVSIEPAAPAFDDTIRVVGSGFTPGAAVAGGLCGVVWPNLGPDGLNAGCETEPVEAVADAAGTAVVEVPFDPATRFQGLGGQPCELESCEAYLYEAAAGGRGEWRDFTFVSPAGSASIAGAVEMLDGAPAPPFSSLSVCGPVGCSFFNAPASGAFEFEATDLPDGTYTLSAGGYVSGTYLSSSSTVEVVGGASVSDVVVQLDADAGTGRLTGTVLDLTDDTVEGASLSLCKIGPSGTCDSYLLGTTSDAAGRFEFRYLDDGTYRLQASAQNAGLSVDSLVTIADGGATDTVIRLNVDFGPASIRGTVVDLVGAPVSATIQACRQLDLGSDCRSAYTGPATAGGAFDLGRLPDGEWSLRAYGDGTSTLWPSTVVSIVGGTSVTDVVLQLPLVIGGGSATGRIVDLGGKVVSSSYGTVCRVNPETDFCDFFGPSYSVSPDSQGRLTRSNLPDGDYRITVRGYNYSEDAVDRFQVVDGGAIDLGDLTVPVEFGDGRIEGSGYDLNGIPVSAWYEACSDELEGCFSGSGTGDYSIPNLPDGTYDITGWSDGAVVTVQDVVIEGGAVVDAVDVEFPIATNGIEGVVLDAAGAAIDGVATGASTWACNTTTFECTGSDVGADGTFLIGVPEPGQYAVTVRSTLGTTYGAALVTGGLTSGVTIQYDPLDRVPAGITVGHVSGDDAANTGGPVYLGSATPLTVDTCPGGTGTWALDFPGEDGDATGSFAEGLPGVFTSEIPADADRAGKGELSIQFDCPDGATLDVTIDVYIDPSGFVRDVDGEPIVGATVTLYRSTSVDGPFEVVPDGSDVMSPSNRTNPDQTDSTGHFGWDVTAGYYKVTAEKDGCRSPSDPTSTVVETVVYEIPPPVFDIDLRLDCSAAPEDGTAPTMGLDASPEPNAAGWNSGPVELTLTAGDEDGGSGLSSVELDGISSSTSPLTTTVEGDGERDVVYSATDRAGNTATAFRTVRIDSVAPTITPAGVIAGGAPLPVGASAVAEFACADERSGVATCEGSVDDGGALDTSTPGTFTVTVDATDNAGNSTTAAFSYEVEDPAVPTDRLRVIADGVLATHVVDAELPAGLTVRVDDAGRVTRVRGVMNVMSESGERLRVSTDVSAFLFWTFGTVDVRNLDTGDRAGGALLFAPPLMADTADEGQRVSLDARGFAAAKGKLAPTRVRLTIDQ